MFFKLSALALIAPLVSALQIQVPENPTTGGEVTIKWTNEAGDPSTWSLELLNVAFHDSFAISNNVQPSSGSLTIELPAVPVADGYTLEAVNITDINQVFATSGSFSIGAATTTLSASSTSASSAASSASGSSAVTGVVVSTTVSSSTSGFGVTVTNPASSSGASAGSTSRASSTSSSAAASVSAFNAAPRALSLGGSASSFAVMVLSAIAGAAFIAL